MTGESNKGSPSNADLTGSSDSSWELVNESELVNVSGSSDSEANSGGDLEVPPVAVDVTASVKAETNDDTQSASTQAEGEVHLYPVSVKTLSGEKLELQLSPGDSVIDVRQFLLDAPETCFITCYDLILHIKDGSEYPLEDYKEISEVADITTGGCSLEMIAAFYDDRSIRSHVRRVRDLLTLSNLYTSLSTLLVLQHEATEQKGADATRLEAPELDGLGLMEDVSGSMHNLIASSRKEIKCIESIVFSSFNPPPSYRRLVGDLIYLDVVTLEGNKFCITGTSKHFYVNSSTGNVLDPLPSKAGHEANTLVEILQKISSKFKKGFHEILERKAAAHPFENVQPPLSQNSWLGLYPIPDHKRDAARAEDSLTLSYGSELIGMQRDWNEELQSCRDFPHSVPQERILRDRALYKVTCDFVEAATNGAIGVINRCIPPINPTDPECFHMYVHNNIFFSFAVDTDLEQVIKDDAVNVKLDVGTKHSEDSTSPDSSAKTSSTRKDTKACISETINSKEPKVSANLSPDTPSEAQIADSEQATYASANNDLKGTKAYQEADVPGLYNLAMAIIDYRGYRVVAQSIIPGILQGDKSDSLLYGSVDNGKKICWDESFHSKVVEAAKRLHLKEHAVRDGSGKVVKLAAPVECKGIVGSDDRQYLLDLMRVTPRDANYHGPGSRFLVLRPELVDSFCRSEAADRSNPKLKTGEEAPTEPVSTDNEAADRLNSKLETGEEVPIEPVSDDMSGANFIEAADRSNSKLETGEEAPIEPVSDDVSGTNLNEAADRSNPKLETGEEVPIEPVSDDMSGANLIEAADRSNSKLETGEEAPIEPVSDDVSGTNLDASVEADTKTTEECVSCTVPSCPPEEILLNPNVFTEYTLAGSEEEIAADEACVRKASSYLIDVALPKFVEELCALEMSPMDGQTLIEALHANGINVRYLGKVANMTRNLPHLWDISATEVVVRSAKHILKDLLRESQDNELGSAISHFLNCFIGDIVTVGTKDGTNSTPVFQKSQESHQSPRKHVKGQMRRSHGTSSTKSHLSYMDMTSTGLWSYISEFARAKYQFEVSDEARLQVKKVHVIRNLCQKVGVTIAARKYDLGSSAPFQTLDILNLQPVVKHTVPTSSDARDLMDTGKARLAEGMLNEAYTLFSEAFNILQQVTGPMHREVSTCCRYLAMVLYHAGDMQGAILQQNKELIINERCLGLDHPDTYHSYANMALFYHGLNQTELALRHMSRALLLLSLSSGPDHPDVSATFINVAMMYQDNNNMNTALRYLQAALKKNERLFGKDHIQTAVCYHALAIAFNVIGAYKLSVQHESTTYDVLLKKLGKDDSRTQDSENWLKIFKIREQQAIAQKQKSQPVCTTSEATTGVDFAKLTEAYRAYHAAAPGNNISATANKSINPALIADALPRRRGVDERAARAAAEVRKKAVAKGLQLRSPGGLPVNSIPLVNSGVKSSVAPGGTQESDAKKEVSKDPALNGAGSAKDTNGSAKNHDRAPVGLGAGLASLESKKQKPKPKPTQ